MKIKNIHDRKTKSRSVAVRLGRGESFEYDQAQWLAERPEDHLLPFTYLTDRNETVLYYDVTGLLPLSRYLKVNSLSSAQYRSMLFSLRDLMTLITSCSYATAGIWCDVDEMFVTERGELRFMFAPLSGLASTSSSTPVALLTYLSDAKRVSFVVDDDLKHARSLKDFVCRHPVLSLTDLDAYLADEYGEQSFKTGSGASCGSSSLGLASKDARSSSKELRSESASARGASKPASSTSFDAVALLSGSVGASQVIAGQNAAQRVLDGVGGYSPTPERRVAARSADLSASADLSGRAPNAAVDGPEPGASAPAPSPARAEATDGPNACDFATTCLSGADPAATFRAYIKRVSTGERFDLPHEGPATIGRSNSCDIQLCGNTNISRQHGTLTVRDGAVTFEDLGSANGSFANGGKVAVHVPVRLRDGDTLRLADEDLLLVVQTSGE